MTTAILTPKKPGADGTLMGKFTLPGVTFGTLEEAFLKKYIWDQWTPEQLKLTEAARIAMADLTLSAILLNNVQVESGSFHTEVYSIVPRGSHEEILRVGMTSGGRTPTSSINRAEVEPAPVRDVLTSFEAWAAEFRGQKYNAGGEIEVDFEVVLHQVRQILLGIQGDAVGTFKITNHAFVLKFWPKNDTSEFALAIFVYIPHAAIVEETDAPAIATPS